MKWYWSSLSSESSGSIDLRDVVEVREVPREQQLDELPFAFIVRTAMRRFILRSSSCIETTKWVKKLQLYCDIAKGGSGTAIVSSSPVRNGNGKTGSDSRSTFRPDSIGGSFEKKLEATLDSLKALEIIANQSEGSNDSDRDSDSDSDRRPKILVRKPLPMPTQSRPPIRSTAADRTEQHKGQGMGGRNNSASDRYPDYGSSSKGLRGHVGGVYGSNSVSRRCIDDEEAFDTCLYNARDDDDDDDDENGSYNTENKWVAASRRERDQSSRSGIDTDSEKAGKSYKHSYKSEKKSWTEPNQSDSSNSRARNSSKFDAKDNDSSW